MQLRIGPHSLVDKSFQDVQSCTSAKESAQWEASWTCVETSLVPLKGMTLKSDHSWYG